MVKKDKPTQVTPTRKLMNDPKYKALVNSSLDEMDRMQSMLVSSGMNDADARLKIQQLYFDNLKLAGDPGAMLQKTMGELATRIELDRIINPEADLVSDKYQTLVDLQIKGLKAQASMNKTMTVNVQTADDALANAAFIDVDEG